MTSLRDVLLSGLSKNQIHISNSAVVSLEEINHSGVFTGNTGLTLPCRAFWGVGHTHTHNRSVESPAFQGNPMGLMRQRSALWAPLRSHPEKKPRSQGECTARTSRRLLCRCPTKETLLCHWAPVVDPLQDCSVCWLKVDIKCNFKDKHCKKQTESAMSRADSEEKPIKQ